jgi:hypothetical protein
MRNVSRILVGQSEGKRPFLRPRCLWNGIIKMDFKKMWCEGVDWI